MKNNTQKNRSPLIGKYPHYDQFEGLFSLTGLIQPGTSFYLHYFLIFYRIKRADMIKNVYSKSDFSDFLYIILQYISIEH